MPRKNLTVRFVESVSVDERTDFQDATINGLSLRVSPTGVKSWNVRYARESDGSKQRLTLGRFPAVSLERARTLALKQLALIAEGGDPAGDKRSKRKAMTFADLARLYIEKYAKRHKKTWAEDKRILDRDVLPAIGTMKAGSVKRRDLLDIIEAKSEAGKGAQSRAVLAVLRKLCNWAVDSDYLEVSPAFGIKPRAKASQRDRLLTDSELRAVWNALDDAPLMEASRDIIRLLALTGQRVGEVAGMTAGEIDQPTAMWTIPAERAKNGRAHTVPLSDMALRIVRKRISGLTDAEPDAPLFARIGIPIESNAIAQGTRKHLQLFDDRWTPHDLRRTAATGIANLGVQPHIIEAVLNHVSGFRAGVAGVYNRNAYDREKRQALDLWATHLEAVVNGNEATVLPLRVGA